MNNRLYLELHQFYAGEKKLRKELKEFLLNSKVKNVRALHYLVESNLSINEVVDLFNINLRSFKRFLSEMAKVWKDC